MTLEMPCLEWLGFRNRDRYGQWTRGIGKYENPESKMHRRAWHFEYGPIPLGMCVLHKCDNPPCVEPTHLFIGTRTDNSMDKVRKGRQGFGGGSFRKPWHELSPTCGRGHPFSLENTRYRPFGHRRDCKSCERLLVVRRKKK